MRRNGPFQFTLQGEGSGCCSGNSKERRGQCSSAAEEGHQLSVLLTLQKERGLMELRETGYRTELVPQLILQG